MGSPPFFSSHFEQQYALPFLHDDSFSSSLTSSSSQPQGLAYFMVATLPPIMGLHTATISPFFFAFLGTSRNILSVGPTALASIYLPTSLEALGYNTQLSTPPDQEARARAASVLTLWVGIIFVCMSLCRLGGLIKFLSFSVMTGFTSACGLYIGLTQMKHILEVHPPLYHYHYQTFAWLIHHLPEANPATTTMGLLSLSFLILIKITKRRYPPTPERQQQKCFRVWRAFSTSATLLVVVLSSLIAFLLHKQGHSLPMVGNVDAGLSQARWPGWRTEQQLPQQPPQQQQQEAVVEVRLSRMFLEALPLALLGFMESYSVGRKMAEVSREGREGRREGGREGGRDHFFGSHFCHFGRF